MGDMANMFLQEVIEIEALRDNYANSYMSMEDAYDLDFIDSMGVEQEGIQQAYDRIELLDAKGIDKALEQEVDKFDLSQIDRTLANIAYVGKITPKNNLKECAAYIIEELANLGIYVHAVSRHSSAYFKFADSRIGSVRLADHTGRKQYHYRWNLYCGTFKQKNSPHKTYWYHIDDANNFVARIQRYAATIKQSDISPFSEEI